MTAGQRVLQRLSQLKLTAEDKYFFRKYGGIVSALRRDPILQARLLHGIVIPPHERVMLRPIRWPLIDEYHYVGSRGSAKCLSYGTEVIMFDGTLRAVEDVVVGDMLMGPDSTPRRVLHTTKGVGDLFRIDQAGGGESYVVNKDHLISVVNSNTLKNPSAKTSLPTELNITPRQYLDMSDYHRKDVFKGYKSGLINFPPQAVTIDPYLLGVWLGDGTGCWFQITSADKEIIDYCYSVCDDYDCTITEQRKANNLAVGLRFVRNIHTPTCPVSNSFCSTSYKDGCRCDTCRKWQSDYVRSRRNNDSTRDTRDNLLWSRIRDYGLDSPVGQKSINKHIPIKYLANTEAVRLALLAGIIDTDGTYANGTYTISQKNERLTRDIKLLADSLGFKTSCRPNSTVCNGTRYPSYRISVGGDIWRIPCKISRKQCQEHTLNKNKNWLLSAITVEPLPPGPFAGFMLDGDHKFLLRDCTVTHNSFTICSMAPTLFAEVYGRKKLSSLSASKFRGGKVIMEEALSLINGTLDSQKDAGTYVKKMLKHAAGLKREGDRWYIPFTTNTVFITVPTGNEESARGLRANYLFLDEADNWKKDTVDRIFGPFLAVRGGFSAPGANTAGNKIFFTGTVSHSHKDWAKSLRDRELLIKRAYLAEKLFLNKDFDSWRAAMNEDSDRLLGFSVHLQRWDYTDLLIPLTFEEHEVFYPSIDDTTETIAINSPDFVKYDRKSKQKLIYTYPVEKEIAERQLEDGLTDFDTWAAEWRNQIIETSGNVYPFDLVERCSTTELLTPEQLSRADWDMEALGPYVPPVLYSCTDPCVLGVDPARTSDDTGFVVIRIGEMAQGTYNPKTGCGHTAWNNVIWAERRRHMTIKDISNKVFELNQRYNLVTNANPTLAPAICIDARGAASGATVRDELASPSPPVDSAGNQDFTWTQPNPIYDPTDKEYVHLRVNQNAWPGLRLLWTTDQTNTEMVSFTKAQMETSKLFLGKYLGKIARVDPDNNLDTGFLGVKALADQLMAVQCKPTQYAYKYFMPGSDSSSTKMRKDLFSAFLYASVALRQHVALLSKVERKTPPMAAIRLSRGGQITKMLDTSYMRIGK